MARAPRPPTFNFLDSFQRSRLRKSTRKLEDILGTTPHVIESSEDFHKFVDPPAGKRKKSKRLHLWPVSDAAATDENSVRAAAAAAATFSSSFHDVPSPLPLTVNIPHPSLKVLDEDPDMPSPDKIARKRVAKLTRILGENIPADLVSHQRCASDPSPMSHHRSRERHRKLRRRSIGATSSSLSTFHSDSSPIQAPSSPRGPTSPVPSTHGRRNLSNDSLYQPWIEMHSRSPSPAPHDVVALDRSSSSSVTYPLLRMERRDSGGWNGEWNVRDANARAMALRNLRSQ